MNTDMLIALAETLSAHRGLKLSTVSTYAAGDGKFFGSLKSGSGCTIRRAENVLNWFHENWPDDLAWPQDIPRPEAEAKSKTARRVA